MQTTHRELPLARWEQRLGGLGATAPYLLLAAATLLAVLPNGSPLPAWPITLVLAGTAAGWMLWFVTLHPAWAQRRRLMGCYIIGLLVVIGLLMARSPWFGLFAFTGYLHAWQFLHGHWRLLGVTATALLATTWPLEGWPQANLAAVVAYLVIVAVTVALVSLFSAFGEVTATQSRQRQLMIAELAETNRRLEAALAQNSGLQAQVLAQAHEAGVRDERQRLAGEIHDSLAQGFTGIITQLEAAGRDEREPEQRRRHITSALILARAGLNEARRSLHALQPAPLEQDPLPTALADLAQAWSGEAGVPVAVTITGTPTPLLPEIEATLYRVAQEALTNVARHAQAQRVWITLSYMEDVVILDVRDDGAGFDAAAWSQAKQLPSGHGLGLPGMARRLERVSGSLTVESAPGRGTALSASVPALAVNNGGETR